MQQNVASTTMYNPMLLVAGRVLIALVFLISGIRKAMAVAGTAGYFAKLGFPVPEVMAWVAIIIEVGGAVLLIIGYRARLVAWLLALFVVIATFAAHRFWEFPDPAQYNVQMVQFLKNLALIGGLLYVASFGAGSSSIDKS